MNRPLIWWVLAIVVSALAGGVTLNEPPRHRSMAAPVRVSITAENRSADSLHQVVLNLRWTNRADRVARLSFVIPGGRLEDSSPENLLGVTRFVLSHGTRSSTLVLMPLGAAYGTNHTVLVDQAGVGANQSLGRLLDVNSTVTLSEEDMEAWEQLYQQGETLSLQVQTTAVVDGVPHTMVSDPLALRRHALVP